MIYDLAYEVTVSPIIIVKDDETTISTSKSNLVAVIVPPVGMRLSVDDIAENDHVPRRERRIMTSHWYSDQVSSRSLVSSCLRTHLI